MKGQGSEFHTGCNPKLPPRSHGRAASGGSRCAPTGNGISLIFPGRARAAVAYDSPYRSGRRPANKPMSSDQLRRFRFFCLTVGRSPIPRRKIASPDFAPGQNRAGAPNGRPGPRRKKPPPVPCQTLLRTRNVQGRLSSGFWIPLLRVGLQAPETLLAPSGYSIGSSKESSNSRTPQRLCTAVSGCTNGIYHGRGRRARAATRRQRPVAHSPTPP